MSLQLPAFVIPLVGNPASNNDVTNALNGAAIIIPQRSTVQFPVGMFIKSDAANNLVTDLSNIVTAEMVLRGPGSAADPADGTLLFDQVIPTSGLNPSLTYAQWQTGLVGHFIFSMSSADTNRPPGKYYLAFGVTTANAGNVPLGFAATVQIVDRGIFNGGTPTTPTALSYTEQESDARYAYKGAAGGTASFAPAVTSVGDGASTSLEAVPTAGLTAPALLTLYNAAADGLQDWLLEPSTAATASGIQRPNDYNASTNAKVWFQKR